MIMILYVKFNDNVSDNKYLLNMIMIYVFIFQPLIFTLFSSQYSRLETAIMFSSAIMGSIIRFQKVTAKATNKIKLNTKLTFRRRWPQTVLRYQ